MNNIIDKFNKALNKYKEVPPFEEFGYKSKTTLWGDFGVADVFSNADNHYSGIYSTFRRVWEQYKDDREGGTELSMVLNHKIWEWYNKDESVARVYDKLWAKLDNYIMNNWKGDDLSYYLRATD